MNGRGPAGVFLVNRDTADTYALPFFGATDGHGKNGKGIPWKAFFNVIVLKERYGSCT